MYIEEITIEGFKSYATRVHIPNFDRYFNAITGLNGSGKSNILDSICFVLGITNLSQVRPSSAIMLQSPGWIKSGDVGSALGDPTPSFLRHGLILLLQCRSEQQTCKSWFTNRARQG